MTKKRYHNLLILSISLLASTLPFFTACGSRGPMIRWKNITWAWVVTRFGAPTENGWPLKGSFRLECRLICWPRWRCGHRAHST